MQKRNALTIALVTLAAGTVALVHLRDTQPWLFYEEVRISRNLRREGAGVKLVDHRIVEVAFTHAPATDDALALLGDLHHLETLKLNSEWHHERGYPIETSQSNIGDAGLLSLKGLPSLKHVSMNLDGTDVTAVGLEGFRSLNSVEYLQVDFNTAASTQDGLQCFSDMTRLRTLRIRGGSRVSWAWFEDFRDDPNHADGRLAAFASAKNLQTVYLKGPLATERGLRAMLANKQQLESVHLEGSFVTDSALESLRGNSSLQSLTIVGPVSDKGLQILGTLKGLRHLGVRRNYKRRDTPVITDEGLLQLNGLRELVTLTVVSSEIEGPGLAIASLPALKGLTITGANIGDDGLEFLPADSKLSELTIDFDAITRVAAGRLLERFPKLTFGPYGRNVPPKSRRPGQKQLIGDQP